MLNSNKEFNTAMFEILKNINEGMLIEDISSKFADLDFDDVFEQCCNSNYVQGVNTFRSVVNQHLVISGSPRLTQKGLQFIENFNP